MKHLAVFYATRQGHTRRVAEHIAAAIRAGGLEVDIFDVRNQVRSISLGKYAAVVLAASVHMESHEREMIAFVKKHRAELEALPSAFISVSLSAAALERSDATPEERAHLTADVRKVVNRFVAQTKWRPNRVRAVAGALLYTRYNFLVRLIMRRIALKRGGDTDTSRDYEYTNWAELDRFAREFAAQIPFEAVV